MKPKEKYIKWLLLILLVVLAITLYRRLNKNDRLGNDTSVNRNKLDDLHPDLRRNTTLIYSKHARCRMECRQIEESEVRDILQHGKVNKSKSQLSADNPRYVLEGRTDDGQQVRIVFAKDDEKLVVVTCIDLEKEWKCNCE